MKEIERSIILDLEDVVEKDTSKNTTPKRPISSLLQKNDDSEIENSKLESIDHNQSSLDIPLKK
jgi:hypothetical protein